ncbi:MAG: shikimate kinase [Streptococcaceae bacterium]|nr:shikimate kinase [Streptococcaceae bacterium]
MSIILIGFMGAGKSTVAKLLSDDFIDLDKMIEQQIEMPISTFFDLFGEDDFRQVEQEVFEAAIHMDFVIATGGGIVENTGNLDILGFQNQVVYLKSDFDSLWQRILKDDKNQRPLAKDKEFARKLFEKRTPVYEKVADLVIAVENKQPDKIAQEIRDWQGNL